MMKSVAFEHDPMQTKWLRTCLRLSSSENFKYAWLDLASLIAPFVIDSAAIRPATNDPIRWPPPAAVRRSKLICAGDKLFRTPRPAPPSKATLCCCRRNRDLRRRASRYSVPRQTKLRFGSRPAVSRDRHTGRPDYHRRVRVSITVVITANTVQKERSYRRLFSASSLEFSIEKME